MCSIAAMDSDGEDEAKDTPSKQKQKKQSAGTETDGADGDEDASTVKEEALGDGAMILFETCRLMGEVNRLS
jgi:hypothetical protein